MTVQPWKRVAGVAALAVVVGGGGFAAEALVRGDATPDPALTAPSDRSQKAAVDRPRRGLLIADLRNKRLLITDLRGNLVWKFANPTGEANDSAGPLGVRWRRGGKILATFGSGDVGQIDAATKTWDWRVNGFRNDYFQSPYDAQLLPDGKLAVATRYDEGGRVAVYNRKTGKRVWRHRISNAHSVNYRPPRKSYHTKAPTLIVGGLGAIRELTYRPGHKPRKVWATPAEFTHGVHPMPDGTILSSEDIFIRRIKRSGRDVWRHDTPNLAKRFARLPGKGFAVSIAEGNRIQFRNGRGRILRSWRKLDNGSSLNYPYGIRLVNLDVVCSLPNVRKKNC